jgi:hypothetical protein
VKGNSDWKNIVITNMSGSAKVAKTLSLERDLLRRVEQTKGKGSSSQRVNDLLKAGLEAERRRSMELEAACFFDSEEDEQAEHRAFQTASRKSLSRE